MEKAPWEGTLREQEGETHGWSREQGEGSQAGARGLTDETTQAWQLLGS